MSINPHGPWCRCPAGSVATSLSPTRLEAAEAAARKDPAPHAKLVIRSHTHMQAPIVLLLDMDPSLQAKTRSACSYVAAQLDLTFLPRLESIHSSLPDSHNLPSRNCLYHGPLRFFGGTSAPRIRHGVVSAHET